MSGMASDPSSQLDSLAPQDLHSLHAAVLEARGAYEVVRKSPASTQWLKPSLESDSGAEEVYELLQRYVQRPEYLATLAKVSQHVQQLAAREAGVELQEVEQQWSEIVRTPIASSQSQQESVGTSCSVDKC